MTNSRICMIAAALAVGGTLAAMSSTPVSAAASAPPPTIPALRAWTPATGTFALRADPAVVVSRADSSALGDEAALLTQDLGELAGIHVSTRVGTARPGDIRLARSSESGLGAEGYRLSVGSVLAVSAPTETGAFYGTRSVLQLLHESKTVPRGTATDTPRYPDRGVMIDAGRRYYSPEFYTRLIKRMAYLKLNLLHLHLSDDAGLGIESTKHPEAVHEQHLTKAQVADIVALAARHHIRVMPEIDMPGHMTGILAQHSELQLKNVAGIPNPALLDVTNPAARTFAKDLLAEYLPIFPGADWHLGADEYLKTAEYPLYPSLAAWAVNTYGPLANGKDAVHDFVNDQAAFVKAHGKKPRMWGDDAGGGSKVRLDRDLTVEWWTNFNPLYDPAPPSPNALVADGHDVLNNGWWPTYFGSPDLPEPDMREAYGKWRVQDFYGVLYYNSTLQAPPYRLSPSEPKNLGAKLAIWGDGKVRTEQETATDSLPHLRVIAQRTWESPDPGDYDAFLAIGDAIGPGPGNGS